MNTHYLPAEWEQQKAVQLTWPHQGTDWYASGLLDKIEKYFVNLAETILSYQDLIIVADNKTLKDRIINLLNTKYKYHYVIYVTSTNDTWARDHGPITVINSKNSEKTILDFDFNAWGGKFNCAKDNKITAKIYKQKAFTRYNYRKIDYILEGGSLDSNGQGTVLTTASCILNKNRNTKLDKQDIVNLLKEYLGIDNLIILENSFLYGDDTDGHIDMMARFCNKNTICYIACDNKNNPNYNNLKKLENELYTIKDNIGKNLELIPIYIPNMIYDSDSNLLPASYINFLIINDAVLVPTYNNEKYDAMALAQFRNIFEDRDVIGINSEIVINQGGSLHCLTMQIPA